MRILYLNFDHGIPVLGDKGASVHVREFVRAAAALGHEVLIACARLGSGNVAPPVAIMELAARQPAGATDRLAEQLNVDTRGIDKAVVSSELDKLVHDRSVGQLVMDAIEARAFRPDFIYERHALFSSAGAQIAARCRCPRILEVNAPLAEEQKRFRGLRLEFIARRMEVESFGTAAAIVAVSDAVKAYVQALVPGRAQCVHVQANGVDLAGFAAGEARRDEVRARIGVGSETGVIGFVGSFKSWHGTDLLFDVFSEIASSRDVHLLAVGDGPKWRELYNRVAQARCRDRVTLPGRVPHADIPGWTSACDVVVAPYQAAEDFYFSPLKVIEALASARAVVAPRIGQLTELIVHGRTGLLYRPDDPQDCRRAVISLLEAPALRVAMGREARQSVAGRGWDRIVERMVELARTARIGAAA